jgi:hypothetical protein
MFSRRKKKKDNKWIGDIICYKKKWNNGGHLVGQKEKIDVNSQHNVKNGITRENCYQFQMQRNQVLKNIRKRSILENWTSWIKSFRQSKFKFEKINWWDSISNKSNKKN